MIFLYSWRKDRVDLGWVDVVGGAGPGICVGVFGVCMYVWGWSLDRVDLMGHVMEMSRHMRRETRIGGGMGG